MRFILSIMTIVAALTAVQASATPYCQPCPYSCRDLGLGSKDCSFVSESRGVCCVDLTKKGLELAEAQSQARQQGGYRDQGGYRGGQGREVCPPGFQPSEQKCSPEERRRGCKDMRLPGGLGCVRR